MKLIGFLSMYNEVEKGNLRRCLDSLSRYCDDIVIYDDASTDDSVQVAKAYTNLIIEGKENEWGKEAEHRQELLELALKQNPDWIFWVDADEVVAANGEKNIRKLCETEKYDCYAFHEINLWRTPLYHRMDNSYNDGLFCRLWKNNGNLEIENKPGLHQRLVPTSLKKECVSDIEIIHYGFCDEDNLIKKYHTYKSHGQSGWALARLIDERTLTVAKSNPDWFDYKLEDMTPAEIYTYPLANRIINEK